MNGARYDCCDPLRRTAVEDHATLNAIDYLEVTSADQTELTLHFVNPLTAQHKAGLSPDTIAIRGGERITDIHVDVVSMAADRVVLRAEPAGDFSRYELALVRSESDPRPPAGFDPVLSTVGFSFKVDCPADFDCRTPEVCSIAPVDAPEIDYLAKDYASFRRLILDRLALLMPDWRERSPADLGITLVELLAYVGDHLSYRQDAVATEGYLRTARRRPSLRRHALLVDYAIGEGGNARAWLQLQVSADTVLDPDEVIACTGVPGLPPRIVPDGRDHRAADDARPEWFEPVGEAPIELFEDLNELFFHTWGDDRCCLPRGATRATLRGHHPALRPGAVLVLEERRGTRTGDPADADAGHRHAVRLTRVVQTLDGNPLTDPLDDAAITEIEWDAADALPFPLCVSVRTPQGRVGDVSVAVGNVVLVDHGRTVERERLDPVPAAALFLAPDPCADRCADDPPVAVHARYRPRPEEGPLTWAGEFDPEAPAAAACVRGAARPAIALESDLGGHATPWTAARDLLKSAGDSPQFVVETERDGSAVLRFGDDEHGRRPLVGETFAATYRYGNGTAGNVGADSIVHAVTLDARVTAVRNPLPASGGSDPESFEQVRRRAPQAFRTQERAVTPADYEAVTVRKPGVQRAAATLRWTGSWNTVFLTVDRLEGGALTDEIERDLGRHVDRYRMAGHDLEFDDPHFVSLEIELFVCVADGHFRSDVRRRLLDVLSSRDLPDGTRGLFHPDSFSFGQTIYLSPILAAARAVPGVASADVTVFQRQGIRDRQYLAAGRMELGRLEIARLDNDPNFPEHGVLRLDLRGGK